MASIDLISSSTFVDAWATANVLMSAADNTFVGFLVTAASEAIQRWLNRWIVIRDYVEIRNPVPGQWDKPDPDYIGLSWFPVRGTTLNPVCTVRTNRSTAMTIANQNTQNVQDAWFFLRTVGDPNFGLPIPIGITVSSMSSGVQTDNTFPFLGVPISTGFSVVASGTGGTLATGTYLCAYSNINDAGESVRSASVSVSVTLGQKITATFPTLIPQATGNNFYVSTANGAASTMTVQNTSDLDQTTFTLATLVSGATFQTNSYATIQDICNAINAIGGGWAAQIQGPTGIFGPWAAWDVWASCGTQIGCLSTGYLQGLDIFQTRMAGAQLDQSSGCLYLPKGATQYGSGPGNVTQWPGSCDVVMGGANWGGSVLLKYGAGFETVPYPIQNACIELVKAMFERFGNDTTVSKEQADKITRETPDLIQFLPRTVRQGLAPYRYYGV